MRRLLAEFDLDDLVLWGGVVFATVALWPTCGRLALLVPGVVMIWLALPTRSIFIERAAPPAVPKTKVG